MILGQNARMSHSFHTEDFIGRLTDALCTTQMIGMEEGGLVRWYTGLPGCNSICTGGSNTPFTCYYVKCPCQTFMLIAAR